MNAALAYLLARLSEPSTYRGLFALLTALGIAISPDQVAAITSLGLAAIGCVNVFSEEAAVKILLACLCALSLTNCAALTSFIVANEPLIEAGATSLVRSGIRAGVAKLEKTSAKNPLPKVSP